MLGTICVICFAFQYIGYRNYNAISHQSNDANVMARALVEFPKSHDGHYPSFQTSAEVFTQLKPLLEAVASKANDEGDHYTTLERLEPAVKKAVWNKSLSGAKAQAGYDAPIIWTFYLPAVHATNRVVIGYSDGKFTEIAMADLQVILKNPGKNQP